MKTSFLLLCLGLLTPLAAAQENPDAPGGAGHDEIHIIEVEHMEPKELLKQILSLLRSSRCRATVDNRTGRIVALGPADELARWDEIAAVFDVPGQRRDGAGETAILPVRHRTAASVGEAVQAAVPGGLVVVDRQRNVLIVRDESSRIDAARQLLETIDVAPASARLELQMLARGGRAVQEPSIRRELERLGLADYGTALTAGVRCVEGERFEVRSRSTAGEKSDLQVQGDLRFPTQGEEVEIRLDVEVVDPTGHAGIETTLRAPIGEHVIIGLSPRGTSEQAAPFLFVLKASRL